MTDSYVDPVTGQPMGDQVIDVGGAQQNASPGVMAYDPALTYGRLVGVDGGYQAQGSDGKFHTVPAAMVAAPPAPKAGVPAGFPEWKVPPSSAPDEIDASEAAPPVHPTVVAKMKQLEQQPQAQAGAPDEIDPSEAQGQGTSKGKALYAPMILAEAERQGLTPAQAQVVVGIAGHESGFDPSAKGPADPHTGHQAQGMFQMFPAAAKDAGISDPFDPGQAIKGGVGYFKQMLIKANGDIPMAVGLYNAGPNAPDRIDPAYVKAVYKEAGTDLPANFRPWAQRVYSLSHAAADPNAQGLDAPWGFAGNTLNDLTLGAGKLAMDNVHAAMYGTSPAQERALSQAYQERWLAANPVAGAASAVLGFAMPDVLVAKGLMAGGRLLAEAAPAAGRVLTPMLGLAGASANPVKAIPAAAVRAVAGGAGLGLLDSQGEAGKPIGMQMQEGAFGGALGAAVAPLAGTIGKGFGALVNAGRDDLAPLYRQAQERVAKMVGTSPSLVDSPIPGVEYTLPEALDGRNQAVNNLFQRVAKGTPELETRVRNNTGARLDHAAVASGTTADWETAKATRDALGDQLGAVYSQSKQKLDLGPALKTLRQLAADPARTKVRDFPEAMSELESKFYKAEEPKGRAKPVASMGDLTSAMAPETYSEDRLYQELEASLAPKAKPAPKLEDQPAAIHGIRKYIQGELDLKDTAVNKMDKNIKGALTKVKEEIDSVLNQVPEAREKNLAFAAAAQHEDELKYMQGKDFANVRGNLNPATIKRALKEIDQAPMKPGVLGQVGRAKSVSDQTRSKLQDLLDDVQRTDRAKVPVGISSRASEGASGGDHGIVSGLFHATAGTGGAFAAHAVGAPMALGWAGGTVGSMAAKKVVGLARQAQDAAMLHVMLHPKDFPPISASPQALPPGFGTALAGGQGYQGLTGAPRERKPN